MRDTERIAAAVRSCIREASCTLRQDVLEALVGARAVEPSEIGCSVLDQLIENARSAARDDVPLCQDTGTVRVRVELGEGEPLPPGLRSAIDAAVAAECAAGTLRASTVRDALGDRSNPGDCTPAVLEIGPASGGGTRVHVSLKGGGSDNASTVTMLEPARGVQGVRDVVLAAVKAKGAGACPPLVVGVGIGGTFDTVASLSKRALDRPLGSSAPGDAGRLEAELLEAVNATGIGPGGLGGRTTALAVLIETAPCHIAALPVAVNIGCCAVRSASAVLS